MKIRLKYNGNTVDIADCLLDFCVRNLLKVILAEMPEGFFGGKTIVESANITGSETRDEQAVKNIPETIAKNPNICLNILIIL